MLYISPPFGNYFTYKNAMSIRGTFTYHRRKGLIWHTARSLRPVKGGWRNQIGFRNPGLSNVIINKRDTYSIAALDSDWSPFISQMPYSHPTSIEINVGCPNVSSYSISDDEVKSFVRCVELGYVKNLSVKLSPTSTDNGDYVKRLCDLGINNFHLSNTIATPKGGISGRQLKDINLYKVEKIAKIFTGRIIAGGGIYDRQDVIDYRNVGATDFSISTVYITKPWHIKEIYNESQA